MQCINKGLMMRSLSHTCSRQSAEHQLISEMKARLSICVLFLFIVYCPASTEGLCVFFLRTEMKARLSICVLLLFIVYCPASTEGFCASFPPEMKAWCSCAPPFLFFCPVSSENVIDHPPQIAGPCCDIQVVSGQGSVDGIYTLTKK